MNGLTTRILIVFFQRFQAFPIGQQLADEFHQRLVDDLFLVIGHQLGGSFVQRVVDPL